MKRNINNAKSAFLKSATGLLVLVSLLLNSNAFAQQSCIGVTPNNIPFPEYDFGAQGKSNSPTVIHKPSRLMWDRCPQGYDFVAGATTQRCNRSEPRLNRFQWVTAIVEGGVESDNQNLSDFTNWRLPNIKELASIAEFRCVDPSMNRSVFPLPQPGTTGNTAAPTSFWSSTPELAGTGNQTVTAAHFLESRFSRTQTTQTNNLLGVYLVRDTQVSFKQEIAPIFKHPRCVNCHAVVNTNFVSGGDGNGVGLPAVHPTVTASTNCTSCHTASLLPAGSLNIPWHAAPASMELRDKTDDELCALAKLVPGSATSALEHLTQDPLVLWSFNPEKPSPAGARFASARPYNVTAWRDLIETWVNFGMPCE